MEFIEQAKARIAAGDRDGAAWIFFQCMSAQDREGFDRSLVEAKHPLSYLAGTTWDRFQTLATL